MDALDDANSGTKLLKRMLGIERRELIAVAWSFAYFFCVLSSYYMIRPIRESMAVGSGPNTIPLLFTGTFVVTMLASPVFGWIASRYPRRVFLPWIYLFFVSNMLIFWLIFTQFVDQGQDLVWLGRVYFVWMSVFNLFVVSIFWSFMADIFTREQGRRLFGVISAAGSIGGLAGSAVTKELVEQIGFHNILPISAAVLSFAIVCITRLRRWVVTDHDVPSTGAIGSNTALGGNAWSGIKYVFSKNYFLAISAKSIIASLLGTALYLFAAHMVETEIPDVNAQTRFFADINFYSLFFTIIGQMFLTRIVVRRFGIGIALVLMPITSIVGFVVLAADPLLSIVATLTVVRRAVGFAFSKPTTDMLYSVVTPEQKYKTKNFIDLAIYRFGDVLTVWSVNPAIAIIGFTGVSLVMLPFAIGWTFIGLWLGRDYRRRAKSLKETGIA